MPLCLFTRAMPSGDRAPPLVLDLCLRRGRWPRGRGFGTRAGLSDTWPLGVTDLGIAPPHPGAPAPPRPCRAGPRLRSGWVGRTKHAAGGRGGRAPSGAWPPWELSWLNTEPRRPHGAAPELQLRPRPGQVCVWGGRPPDPGGGPGTSRSMEAEVSSGGKTRALHPQTLPPVGARTQSPPRQDPGGGGRKRREGAGTFEKAAAAAFTWNTSVWPGCWCACCSPPCCPWCWLCHWDQTSEGRPGNCPPACPLSAGGRGAGAPVWVEGLPQASFLPGRGRAPRPHVRPGPQDLRTSLCPEPTPEGGQ